MTAPPQFVYPNHMSSPVSTFQILRRIAVIPVAGILGLVLLVAVVVSATEPDPTAPVECCDVETCGCVNCECDADSHCRGCDGEPCPAACKCDECTCTPSCKCGSGDPLRNLTAEESASHGLTPPERSTAQPKGCCEDECPCDPCECYPCCECAGQTPTPIEPAAAPEGLAYVKSGNGILVQGSVDAVTTFLHRYQGSQWPDWQKHKRTVANMKRFEKAIVASVEDGVAGLRFDVSLDITRKAFIDAMP